MIVKSILKVAAASLFGAFIVYQVKKRTTGVIDDE